MGWWQRIGEWMLGERVVDCHRRARATNDDTPLRYEDGAERVLRRGWMCSRCGTFYGNDPSAEHVARYCCSNDFPCECGARKGKHWTCCQSCRDKHDIERHAKRERRPWDGEQMLYSHVLDKYFSSPEDLCDHLEDNEDSRDRDALQVVLCDPNRPRPFELVDFVSDDLPEDGDDFNPPGAAEIEKAVNDYLNGLGVLSWSPGKCAWDGTSSS
jgi:hypothetical protein